MHHCGTQRLETERLILRKFVPDDAAAMYQNWASDDAVTKYLTWPTHSSFAESQAVVNDWVKAYARADCYQWAIVCKQSGEPIGSISVVHLNDAVAMAHLGYCIGRPWWHRGIASEALKAVMDFLFDRVGVNRIEAAHDRQNPRSGRVMQRCGMTYEGTLRSAARNNQGVCDVCYYALLKSER